MKHVHDTESDFDNVYCPVTNEITDFTANDPDSQWGDVNFCAACREAEPEEVQTTAAVMDQITAII